MSLLYKTECDWCHRPTKWATHSRLKTVGHRDGLIAEGWKRVSGLDKCPECIAKEQAARSADKGERER